MNGKNLIVITTDQQRYDSLGCNGGYWMRTPCLDEIARAGARFERAYCPNPVCTPSRVSLMTGLMPSRHGSYNIGTRVFSTEHFLSTRLQREGYCCHHIGKAHFYPWDVSSPENCGEFPKEGLKDFAGFETAEISIGHSDWGVNGHYERWLEERGIRKGRHMPQLQVKRLFEKDAYGTGDWGMPVSCHSGAWILERSEKFLRERRKDRPFYLNLGFQDPHHPLALPCEQPRLCPESIPRSRGGYDSRLEHQEELANGRILDGRFAGPLGIAGNQNTSWASYTHEQKQVIRSYYYSMVELFDQQIGQLLKLLEKYQVSEDTMLVITSDHGDMLFDHGIGEKGPLAYEEVVKVPLLIRFPGMIKPGVVKDVVSLTDIVPTVLDYLEIGGKPVCDGVSLRPLLEGEKLDREGVRIEFKEETDAVRYKCFVTKEWKLTEYMGEAYGELYHLKEDPGEQRNLYFEEACLPVKYELLRMMIKETEKREFCAERPCRC